MDEDWGDDDVENANTAGADDDDWGADADKGGGDDDGDGGSSFKDNDDDGDAGGDKDEEWENAEFDDDDAQADMATEDGEQELTVDIQIANIFYEAEGQTDTDLQQTASALRKEECHLISSHLISLSFLVCMY